MEEGHIWGDSYVWSWTWDAGGYFLFPKRVPVIYPTLPQAVKKLKASPAKSQPNQLNLVTTQ